MPLPVIPIPFLASFRGRVSSSGLVSLVNRNHRNHYLTYWFIILQLPALRIDIKLRYILLYEHYLFWVPAIYIFWTHLLCPNYWFSLVIDQTVDRGCNWAKKTSSSVFSSAQLVEVRLDWPWRLVLTVFTTQFPLNHSGGKARSVHLFLGRLKAGVWVKLCVCYTNHSLITLIQDRREADVIVVHRGPNIHRSRSSTLLTCVLLSHPFSFCGFMVNSSHPSD